MTHTLAFASAFAMGAALVAGGCEKPSAKHDAAPPNDSTGDGADPDATQCAMPAALPACASPVAGTNIRLRRIGTTAVFTGGQAPVRVTAPPEDPRTNAPQLPGNVTSMNADARGEIWVTTLGGSLYHLEAMP